ncbi:2-dehydropantoate 2-reductase [Bacillus sp. HMF5848]|uniref:2-dehydropantoate 2-reductase n=1 Tax=Bacillus sp. HMF5848 TaxID=2495421 RepID=UPI00163AED6C|nr:2-dehydropantoate 2-reductase [Bacillus sp. HMF5848]
MDIAIIGGGSIGLHTAAYLAENHHVKIFTKRKEQSERLCEYGIDLLHVDGKVCHVPISAEQLDGSEINADLVIVTVKEYHLDEILVYLEQTKIRSTLLFLQNGIGHVRKICNIANESVLLGVVEHGAYRLSDYEVAERGKGVIKIASFRGNKHIDVCNNLNSDDFPIEAHSDWETMLTDKLVINAVINPISATLRVKNGQIFQNKFINEIAKNIFNEINIVLEREAKRDNDWQRLKIICEKTADNRSSMLRDIEQNGRTEVEAIIAPLITKAIELGVETPYLKNYYYVIKALEAEGR